MKCRNIINGQVQWFNNQSIAEDADAVRASLTQKLSTIKGEIIYNIQFGLPLYDKVKSKVFIDSQVLSIVQGTTGVMEVTSFSSAVVNHKYRCSMQIHTQYGDLSITV